MYKRLQSFEWHNSAITEVFLSTFSNTLVVVTKHNASPDTGCSDESAARSNCPPARSCNSVVHYQTCELGVGLTVVCTPTGLSSNTTSVTETRYHIHVA